MSVTSVGCSVSRASVAVAKVAVHLSSVTVSFTPLRPPAPHASQSARLFPPVARSPTLYPLIASSIPREVVVPASRFPVHSHCEVGVTAKPVAKVESVTPTSPPGSAGRVTVAGGTVDVVAEREATSTSATPTEPQQMRTPLTSRGVDVAAKIDHERSSATPTPPAGGGVAILPLDLVGSRVLGKIAPPFTGPPPPVKISSGPPRVLFGLLAPLILLISCPPPWDEALARAWLQVAPLLSRACSLPTPARRSVGGGGGISSSAPHDEYGLHVATNAARGACECEAQAAVEDVAVVQVLGGPVRWPPRDGVRPAGRATVRARGDAPPRGQTWPR